MLGCRWYQGATAGCYQRSIAVWCSCRVLLWSVQALLLPRKILYLLICFLDLFFRTWVLSSPKSPECRLSSSQIGTVPAFSCFPACSCTHYCQGIWNRMRGCKRTFSPGCWKLFLCSWKVWSNSPETSRVSSFWRYQEAYDYYSQVGHFSIRGSDVRSFQAIMADPDSALLRSNRSGGTPWDSDSDGGTGAGAVAGVLVLVSRHLGGVGSICWGPGGCSWKAQLLNGSSGRIWKDPEGSGFFTHVSVLMYPEILHSLYLPILIWNAKAQNNGCAAQDKCCQLRPDWYKSHVRQPPRFDIVDGPEMVSNAQVVDMPCSSWIESPMQRQGQIPGCDVT